MTDAENGPNASGSWQGRRHKLMRPNGTRQAFNPKKHEDGAPLCA